MRLNCDKELSFLVCYRSNVPKGAAFTGSMQLLAGVKLCTGRPITNHPHYEDKHLRFKTKEVGGSEKEFTLCQMSCFYCMYIYSFMVVNT